ncbi:MAG: D-glycero-beta-D-manno-heptose-1,7-bisphosphate 7-phosphatase [Alphaproteobacteria bacterium MarineAlpha3_Bin5]|nr:HAD family hydrolase [Magnetovibrio sp.]PPR76195.1 MAG: D-glycero-beta-D-manno-heptose-1,7-bisphosphate 7-phosphatase [Alphaproteobacteria bacterium MarineAlpha3_Bin5]
MKNKMELPFGAKIDADGKWQQLLNKGQKTRHGPALFLDRDGVVVEEVHYLNSSEDTHLCDGAIETISLANKRAIPVILVTNQSGIGRGKISWVQFIKVQEKMMNDLALSGCFFNAVFACPHHEAAKPPLNAKNHHWRKPNPGMLFAATEMLPIDLSASWIIGDKATDLIAGQKAGLNGGMLVLTGYGSEEEEKVELQFGKNEKFSVRIGSSIADAPSLIPILST